jgi:hypothetical protein
MFKNKGERSFQASMAWENDDDVEFIVQRFNRKRRLSVRQPEKSKIFVQSLEESQKCDELEEDLVTVKQEASESIDEVESKSVDEVKSKSVDEVESKSVDEVESKSIDENQNETLIFLDWDDTLFCGHICRTSIKPSIEYIMILIQFIRLLKTQGRIYIVTNAQEGWVQHCINIFMPELIPEFNDITIFSAQSNFKIFSDNPEEWKRHSFEHLILSNGTKPKTVMSIGDANYERNAIKKAVCNLAVHNSISIKLREQPTCEVIIEQYKLLMPQIKTLLEKRGHYDYIINVLS